MTETSPMISCDTDFAGKNSGAQRRTEISLIKKTD